MLRRGVVRCSSVAASALLNGANYTAYQAKQARALADTTARYTELNTTKQQLDEQAQKYPDRHAWGIFAYLVAQNAVLFQWTYYQFDWNLVEPITYLLGYSVTWLCTLVYFAFGKEFTYDSLREHLTSRRRDALYAASDFDIRKFRAVEARRARLAAQQEREKE
mmetsp:Transcript_20414/g.63455  ORF Transcript_20414/g.63455 Transcript_20414/m.63455 type:complete len:164 (-) Transcript_20414:45-536(-)